LIFCRTRTNQALTIRHEQAKIQCILTTRLGG
jgi:hypothetical protein